MLADLALFIAVVEAGNFRLAAEQLGISPATITRRVQALERSLHCQLLIRSSKHLVLTEAGERLFQENAPHLQRVNWQLKHFQADMTDLAGKIRLLAPNNLSRTLLMPMLSAFMRQYPNIDIAIYVGSQIEALAEYRADLAIRVEPEPDTNLRYRKLAKLNTIFVTTPSHAKTLRPVHEAKDVVQQVSVSGLKEDQLTICHVTSQQQTKHAIAPRFFVNDLAMGLEMLQHCPGIMLCPISEAIPFIARAELVQVYPQWQGPVREVYALWNAQNFMLPRTRALLDYLSECFEQKQTEFLQYVETVG